ncbi:MAG: helix-turn-helix domain-containing protein [Lachnospira sp.]
MKELFIQPFVTIAAGNTYESRIISKPSQMLIYSFRRPDNSDAVLKFIPGSMNEWIICYNNKGSNAQFICIGAATRSTDISLPGFDNYVGIRFADTTCYYNKGIANAAYTGDILNNYFVYAPERKSPEADLIKELQTCSSLKEKCSAVSTYISLYKECFPIPDNLHSILSEIKSSNGSVTVAELSEMFGYSARHIQRLFNSVFGFGPKDYCRFMRFQYVLSEILTDPDRENSEFIIDSGYSDQAHFQREFKSFTGITPKQLIRLYKSI